MIEGNVLSRDFVAAIRFSEEIAMPVLVRIIRGLPGLLRFFPADGGYGL